MIENPNLHVITGGPGAGKTTVLLELEKRGSPHLEEIARRIIQEQVATGGVALPWGDTSAYTALMLEWTVRQFHDHLPVHGPMFCDRGLPDVWGYARLIGLPDIHQVASECRRLRYNQRVFIAPPWKEIYTTDSEGSKVLPSQSLCMTCW